MKCYASCFFAALFLPCTLTAQVKDVAGSKDHPSVSRFAGSVIKFYDQKNFDAYALRLGPIDRGKEAAAKKQDLEGAVTRIIYQSPKTTSVLEVFRNYEQALLQGGFEQMYQCELDACGNYFSGSYPSGSIGHVRGFVEQVGHTDSDGGFDFNQQLSQQRAQAVVDELTQKHGIAVNRLTAKSVSYLCPVADNGTDAGKAKNRRVELVKQKNHINIPLTG